MHRADGFAEPGVQRQVRERHIPEFTGDGEATGAQGLADAGLGVVRMMDVEMNPPRSIVIIEVMIAIPRIGAEG